MRLPAGESIVERSMRVREGAPRGGQEQEDVGGSVESVIPPMALRRVFMSAFLHKTTVKRVFLREVILKRVRESAFLRETIRSAIGGITER
jgi:hypothetical protein